MRGGQGREAGGGGGGDEPGGHQVQKGIARESRPKPGGTREDETRARGWGGREREASRDIGVGEVMTGRTVWEKNQG